MNCGGCDFPEARFQAVIREITAVDLERSLFRLVELLTLF